VAFAGPFFSLFFSLPLLFFVRIPPLDIVFWQILFINGCTMSLAFILYMKAIKVSPLSITIPMLAFTPLFLLVTSPLILSEFPSIFGLLGIILIVLGAYVLSIKDVRKGFLEPFKALFKEKGVLFMLVVAFLFSLGSNFSKIAIQHSNPIVYTVMHAIFMSSLLFPISLIKSEKTLFLIKVNLKKLFPIGLFHAITIILALVAMEMVIVPYLISVRRSAIIFSTLYGYFFFKERRILERLTGAVVMVFGILIISLF
jgi:drug/metabolite transporter (DMT)-like permease